MPEKDSDGNWTFTTDRELKIMHLTDIHVGGGWLSAKNDSMAINAVVAMVKAEKPDLVVVTGDIVYDNIKQNQVDWYKNTVEKNNEYNNNLIANLENKDELLSKYDKLNTLLFFHIPLQEYKDAWFQYVENGYKDTDDIKLIYGTAGETGDIIYCGVDGDNLFETMQALGGKHGIFCGHDHVNNFSIDYKGIRLTYGLSVDYLAYFRINSLGSQHGCTMITVKPDGSFDCTPENYYQDKYAHDAREEVIMQFMSVME